MAAAPSIELPESKMEQERGRLLLLQNSAASLKLSAHCNKQVLRCQSTPRHTKRRFTPEDCPIPLEDVLGDRRSQAPGSSSHPPARRPEDRRPCRFFSSGRRRPFWERR